MPACSLLSLCGQVRGLLEKCEIPPDGWTPHPISKAEPSTLRRKPISAYPTCEMCFIWAACHNWWINESRNLTVTTKGKCIESSSKRMPLSTQTARPESTWRRMKSIQIWNCGVSLDLKLTEMLWKELMGAGHVREPSNFWELKVFCMNESSSSKLMWTAVTGNSHFYSCWIILLNK